MINFTITFTRTINNITSTVTAFSKAATHGGAILDTRIQTRRADTLAGEVATYGDFVVAVAR